jgi:hypothetical protein
VFSAKTADGQQKIMVIKMIKVVTHAAFILMRNSPLKKVKKQTLEFYCNGSAGGCQSPKSCILGVKISWRILALKY